VKYLRSGMMVLSGDDTSVLTKLPDERAALCRNTVA
jgi:hypothetical protein